MNEKEKQALEEIENQLYRINSRNISLRWIGMKQGPTDKDISELNKMLGFIIKELRTLRETGELNVEELHEEFLKKWNQHQKIK